MHIYIRYVIFMLCRRVSGYRSRIMTFYSLVTVHNIREVPCKGKENIQKYLMMTDDCIYVCS